MNMMKKSTAILMAAMLIANGALSGCSVAQTTAQAPQTTSASSGEAPQITGFNGPYLFSYGSWQDKAKVQTGKLSLSGFDGKGGLGDNAEIDLSGFRNFSPVIKITIGPNNKAKNLRLSLRDDKGGASTWNFPLSNLAAGQSVIAIPENGASLAQPSSSDDKAGPVNLKMVRQWQIQGDWGGEAVDVSLDEVNVIAPNTQIAAARTAFAKKQAEEAEKLRQQKAEALKNIKHDAEQPKIERVYAAAPDIIGIRIQEGVRKQFSRVPYVEQPGDTIEKDGAALVVNNGKIEEQPGSRKLKRKGKIIGYVVGGRDHNHPHGKLFFQPAEERTGAELQKLTAEDAASYRVNGAEPVAVYRKSKPNDQLQPNGEQLIRHVIYLKLAKPLAENQSVNIEFPGLNVDKPSTQFVHNSQKSWSEAVHASHLGYRPDDPFKRAFLSLWLGTGGAYEYSNPGKFQLLDDKTGKSVFEGDIKLLMGKNDKEKLRLEKNYAMTAVYGMDFSGFKTAGVYRVHVPGVGCSYPFPIANDAHAKSFEKAMKGFLHQRSGLHLQKPWSDYDRPRDLHPADGIKVYVSKYGVWQADALGKEEGKDWFGSLVKGRTEEVLPHAWGGYHDAGDFDRHYNHLWATYQVLELMEMHPAYFAKQKLSLPPTEVSNKIPDTLDEALWNLDCFRRLQRADGGVYGGIESSSHPRYGETSYLESLVVLAYAPDAAASYTFAAVAAKAARVLKPYDAKLSQTYAQAATKAFDWAEKNRETSINAIPEKYKNFREEQTKNYATAAAEILHLTRDAKYDTIFKANAEVAKSGTANGPEQQNAAFAYALMPKGIGDEALKQKCIAAFKKQADVAIGFAEANVFGLTTDIPSLPEMGPVGYWTTPGMITTVAPRAHFLTKEAKYLEATVRSGNFNAGANPDNIVMTSGMGHEAPRSMLHFDSRYSQQPLPTGYTPYGSTDPQRTDGFNEWVHIWMLPNTMKPNSRTWPGHEFYVDFFIWPMMVEFTIKQNIGPVAYHHGYLASRP
jgi:endoglucanase